MIEYDYRAGKKELKIFLNNKLEVIMKKIEFHKIMNLHLLMLTILMLQGFLLILEYSFYIILWRR